MERDGQNFLSFWTIFLPFYPPPLTTRKIKILKDIIILHNVPKIMIICSTVPEKQRVTDAIFIFSSDYFLPFYPPHGPKYQHLPTYINIAQLKKADTSLS